MASPDALDLTEQRFDGRRRLAQAVGQAAGYHNAWVAAAYGLSRATHFCNLTKQIEGQAAADQQ